MSKFTQAQCSVFLLYLQNTVREYTSLTITDSLSWKSSVCISSESFKHPLSVCNPDLPGPVIFAHHRNNGAICLASRPGQGRQLSPSAGPKQGIYFKKSKWLNFRAFRKRHGAASLTLFSSFWTHTNLLKLPATEWTGERQKCIRVHIQAVYMLFSKRRPIQEKDLQKKCIVRNSRMPTVLH